MNRWKARFVFGFLCSFVFTASSAVRYVNVNSTNPTPPFTNWNIAAVAIQDAIDLADVGDTVLVTNGIYQTGGRVSYGSLSNRVWITKAVAVQSVNGPEVTLIKGYQMPGLTNGFDSVRCVYITNGASLAGFTLTNGSTTATGYYQQERYAGGALGDGNGLLSNCVITGNTAYELGGGAYGTILKNCLIRGNTSGDDGGGAIYCTLTNCIVAANSSGGSGGGAYGGPVVDCVFSNNVARYGGGIAGGAYVLNCTLTGNSASVSGGGAHGSTLTNCFIRGNSTVGYGGGGWYCTFENSILTQNTASVGGGASHSTLNSCILSNNTADLGGGQRFGT